mgnify:CR=1 FL=1
MTFWKDDTDMPGVADAIRKTTLIQEQRARKQDMQELINMVNEGRLHEADERQLETLKLSLELNDLLQKRVEPANIDTDALTDAVTKAVQQAVKNIPSVEHSLSPDTTSQDVQRPGMKHTSLADLAQSDEKIEIVDSGNLVQEGPETKGSADKLAKLKKLKDGQG